MDNETVIQVQKVSKKYSRSLRYSMYYGILDIGRNILGLSSGSHKLRKNEFWAVKDLSFEVQKGETLGIIGPNGSGKSTLLKMINGIFWPDKGKISVKGRVGALIEVGAGFHPLLTGRENLFINGAILGMTKKELVKRFDDIVDFADIGAFIDTPVKNYSSGMFVRLGFAIAVHCRPDVLLVDEVLAVGDLAFQARCREKIRQVRRDGVTIFLVSHNMHTISHLCDRTIFLNYGEQVYTGDTSRAIDIYRQHQQDQGQKQLADFSRKGMRITGLEILDRNNRKKGDFHTGDYVKFRIHLYSKPRLKDPIISVSIYNESGDVVTAIRNDADNISAGEFQGKGYIDLEINKLNLLPDVFTLNVTLLDADGFTFYDRIEGAAKIRIPGGKKVHGVLYLPHQWHFFFKPGKAQDKV